MTPPGENAGFWRFDYQSPDLSGNPNWQGLPEIALSLSTNTGIQLSFQPIFTYRYADNTLHDFAPWTESDGIIFYDLSGGTTVYAPTMRPADVTLTQIRVRVFGEYFITTPELFVHLNMICPMPSRFPSILQAVLGELSSGKSKKAVAPGR